MRARWLVLGMLLLSPGVRADGDLEDPEIARRAGPPPRRSGGAATTQFLKRGFDPQRSEAGALAGKTIYLSAGHGWVWDVDLGRWRTQRGNTHDLVEDFISTETISQHLIPLLHDMGAYVVPVREADMSSEMLIVDDTDAAIVPAITDEAAGFHWPMPLPNSHIPLPGGANPFANGGSTVAVAGSGSVIVARWPVDETIEAMVYLSWVQAPDRAPDAHYVIHHAGGDSHVRVDQRRHGSTWVLLGSYRFESGAPLERRSIDLLEDSATPGATLSIDAIRIGGGMSHVSRGTGAEETSGRPAFEDGARYQTQWNGAPASVWDYSTSDDGQDDVGSRSRFSAWEHEPGEDAVYVAWHTNAPSPARGTSSYVYGPSAFGPLSEFSGVPGSLELMDAIHSELVADLRAAWEPTWQDRTQHTAYFGEVNPTHNPEMPATLIEVAFHDTLEDAAALREPRFRHLASRAIAQGIAKYFATRDGTPLTLPPDAIEVVHADSAADGALVLGWYPPQGDGAGGDPATSYLVYLSRDGRSFDDGHPATETTLTIPGAQRDGVRFARVVAINAGGRSRPSPVVGADGRRPEIADVLVVAGFSGMDGTMLFHENLASRGLGTVDRAYESRINDGTHAARIGVALAEAGYGFATTTANAVLNRGTDLDPARYRAVVWLTGKQPVPLGGDVRAALAAYVAAGGTLVLTGNEVTAELAADDAALLATLGATLVSDDAGTYALTGRGTLVGESFTFGDDGPGSFDADAPDVLEPAGGATALLAYDGGEAAAVLGGRTALFGFPIETVPAVTDRARILAATLGALGLVPEPAPDPVDPGDDEPGGCCDSAGNPAPSLLLFLGVLLALTRRRRVTNMRPS